MSMEEWKYYVKRFNFIRIYKKRTPISNTKYTLYRSESCILLKTFESKPELIMHLSLLGLYPFGIVRTDRSQYGFYTDVFIDKK